MSVCRSKNFTRLLMMVLLISPIISTPAIAGDSSTSCVGFLGQLKELFVKKQKPLLHPPPASKIYPSSVSELFEMGEFQRAIWSSKTKVIRTEIEDFLKNASIVEVQANIGGKSGAKKVFLEGVIEGKKFKTTAILKNSSVNREIAAHEFDQMLNLDISPMIVERQCGGEKCSIQLFVGDTVSGKQLNHERWVGTNDLTVEMFDYLISNTDRHHENYLYTLDSHRLVAIDAGQSFGFSGFRNVLSPKTLNGAYDQKAQNLIEALSKLSNEKIIQKLNTYLSKSELDDLLVRKEKLLEYSKKLTPNT